MAPVGAAAQGIRSGGFSPDQIASLTHWYDATTISGSDGNAIGTWADQEGTDDLTQATSSKKPTLRTSGINSKNILEFDGSDDFMSVDITDLSQPNHIFAVAKLRSADTGTFRTLYDGGTNDEQEFRVTDSNVWEIFAGSGLGGSGDDTNPHIFSALFNSTSSVLRVDGVDDATGDAGTDSMTGISVGAFAGENFHGPFDFGEFLIYDANLSDSDRDDVESYLSGKWGITI